MTNKCDEECKAGQAWGGNWVTHSNAHLKCLTFNSKSLLGTIWESFRFFFELLGFMLQTGRKRHATWKTLREHIWGSTPTRCLSCRGWFMRDFFWNPWGPGSGPGLTCSAICCKIVQMKEARKP